MPMICDCGRRARVIDSRSRKDDLVYRQHECPEGHRFHSLQMRMEEYQQVLKTQALLKQAREALESM